MTVLIEKGAEIKTADSLGRQPLHYAAYSDFTSKCCDLLLKNGADSRVFDRLGFTPLFYASVSGHPVTVEMFLKLFGHYETEKIKRAKFSISALHIAA